MSQAGEKELVGVKLKASDGIKLFRIPQKIWRKKTLFSSVSKIQARMRKLCHLFLHDETTEHRKNSEDSYTRRLHNSSPHVDIDIYRARTLYQQRICFLTSRILFGIGKTKNTWKVERE